MSINLDATPRPVQEYVPEGEQLFTCLSCEVAFKVPDDQREHMKSDWHRYNMKRRVAGLPPITAGLFNQKIIERRNENAVTAAKQGEICEPCGKAFQTQGAYRTHIQSKKHKEVVMKIDAKLAAEAAAEEGENVNMPAAATVADQEVPSSTHPHSRTHTHTITSSSSTASSSKKPASASLLVPEDADEDEIEMSIDAKIAMARTRLTQTSCLFCSATASSFDDALKHMSLVHGFFVPEQEYLVDRDGLMLYLSEKVSIGNVCLYCNGKGKEYRSMEAVRKHMIDKSHCKIAYSSESEKLEFAEFYDFSTSYPDHLHPRTKKGKKTSKRLAAVSEEWEDMDVDGDDEDADEIIVEEGSDEDEASDGDSEESGSESDLDEEDLGPQIAFDSETFELVLPNGKRLGHRSLNRYYKQNVRPVQPEHLAGPSFPNRRLIGDKNSLMIAKKGGFGAYGNGQEMVKARNAGEARHATRNVREFRDQKRREMFKTKTGYIHNSQKHFRDPLLQ